MRILNKYGIWIILAAALAVKIAFAAFVFNHNPGGIMAADSSSYWQPAQSILQHGTFSVSPDHAGMPETTRTPGYPFFIFLVLTVLYNSAWSVIFVQLVISLATIYLACNIGGLVFDKKTGVMAGMFTALDLTALASTNMILTETLFDFLLILGTWCVLRAVSPSKSQKPHRLSWQLLLMASLCFGSATLVRPVLYYFFPFFWIFCLVNAWKQGVGLKRTAWITGCVVIPAVLMVGGWQIRNFYQTGNSSISSIQGKNFLYYRAAGVYAMKNRMSMAQARQKLRKQFFEKYPELESAPPAELSPFETREGIAIILAHPMIYAKAHLRGSANMMVNPGTFRIMNLLGFDFQRKNGQSLHDQFFELGLVQFLIHILKTDMALLCTLIVGGIILLCVYGFACAGLFRTGANLLTSSHMFMLMLAGYLLLISGGPEGHDRFREPVMPLIAVYAGYGFWWIFKARQK